jgi:hypothetical protein
MTHAEKKYYLRNQDAQINLSKSIPTHKKAETTHEGSDSWKGRYEWRSEIHVAEKYCSWLV